MHHHHFLLQIFNQEILHQYLHVNQSKIILDLMIIDHSDLIIMEDMDLVDMVINIGDLMDMEDIVHIVHMVHIPIIIIMECLVGTVVMPKIGKKLITCHINFICYIIFNLFNSFYILFVMIKDFVSQFLMIKNI